MYVFNCQGMNENYKHQNKQYWLTQWFTVTFPFLGTHPQGRVYDTTIKTRKECSGMNFSCIVMPFTSHCRIYTYGDHC